MSASVSDDKGHRYVTRDWPKGLQYPKFLNHDLVGGADVMGKIMGYHCVTRKS